MQLKLITLAFDPATGAFPPDPLCDVPGEVVQVAEHFFQHQGVPHLLLIVHYRARQEGPRVEAPAPNAPSPRDTLSADEQELFDRLRLWRNQRSQTEGVPPYTLLTNRQLVEIVRTRPATLQALQSISGIGEARGRRFGTELLMLIPGRTTPGAATVQDGASLSAQCGSALRQGDSTHGASHG